MSDEQINIAIAEACGWKEIQSSHAPVEFGRRPHGWKRTEHGNRTMETQIPDYCNDLNAMHEAEKTLKLGLRSRYDAELGILGMRDNCFIWETTASQRAEAFLKTIGKWIAREMNNTPETDEIALHPATTAWVWREHSRKLERERDEAREECDNLKQELEIVTARLHGKKHPLDNGIPERHEVYIWKNGKYELDP
jgi:hypothetical protein